MQQSYKVFFGVNNLINCNIKPQCHIPHKHFTQILRKSVLLAESYNGFCGNHKQYFNAIHNYILLRLLWQQSIKQDHVNKLDDKISN